jgi:hypothetical protein
MKGFAEAQVIVLYSLKDPGPRDNWMLARPFSVPVQEPVEVTVVPDNEEGILLPFYGVPQIMRTDVLKVLVDVGVNNWTAGISLESISLKFKWWLADVVV